MRIRTLKPEWLDDERLIMASPAARVLSVALILLADDYGRGRGNPDILVPRIFPGHPRESREAYAELARLGFFRAYEVRGQTYFEIANWSKHQRVDRPGKPRVPAPSEADAKDRESHAKDRESHATDPDRDHDPDHEIVATPSGSRETEKQADKGKSSSKPSQEAYTLADYLRRRMLGAKPDHRIGRGANSESKWPLSAQRRKWAQSAARMHRIDGRDWRRSSELVAWVYGPANMEGECSYVVESMDALREKWDRLDAAARRSQRREEEQPMIIRRGYGE